MLVWWERGGVGEMESRGQWKRVVFFVSRLAGWRPKLVKEGGGYVGEVLTERMVRRGMGRA